MPSRPSSLVASLAAALQALRRTPLRRGLADCTRRLEEERRGRERAEAALREIEAHGRRRDLELESLYRDAPIGLAVVGRDLRFVRVNRLMAEVNGVPVEEHLGRPVREVLPDLAETLEAIYRQVLTTGRPLLGRELRGTTPARSDERTWRASYHPLRDADGSVAAVSCIVEDVTERRRAEEVLRESNELLEARVRARTEELRLAHERLAVVQEGAAVGTFEWDVDANEALGSPQYFRLYGLEPSSEPIRYADWIERVHERDRERVRKDVARAVRNDEAFDSEFRVMWPDGSVHWLSGHGRTVRDERGDRPRLLGLVVDVTARRRLEEQVVRSQKMQAMGTLAGGVAHDFNNLLTVIRGYADELAERLADRPRLAEATAQIRAAAERGAELTSQLLTFARRQPLRPETLEVNALVEAVASLARGALGARVRLSLEPAPEAGAVEGDRGRLEQVLLNLCVNACDAMPGGGTLTLRTGWEQLAPDRAAAEGVAPGAYARIEVCDTGIGMDEETRERLFEPFFTTKGAGGTGLGLPMAWGIVRQSGGTIRVESEPGRGSRFSVLLPRAGEAAAAAEPVPSPAGAGGPSGSGAETVLLVDDEPALRALLALALEDAGFRVLTAGDGEEALATAASHPGPIDVLVSDVVMPRLGGHALGARLARARPGLRMLFVSGRSGEGGGSPPPGAERLAKPFGPDVLVARIRALLARHAPRPDAGPDPQNTR